MAKTPMLCPFSGKLCRECPLFRGRHYFLCNNEHYRGYIKPVVKPEEKKRFPEPDFDTLENLCEPWATNENGVKSGTKIKLKLIDKVNGTTRNCKPSEIQEWEWDNPNVVRTCSGRHLTKDKLIKIISYEEARGTEEIVITESTYNH